MTSALWFFQHRSTSPATTDRSSPRGAGAARGVATQRDDEWCPPIRRGRARAHHRPMHTTLSDAELAVRFPRRRRRDRARRLHAVTAGPMLSVARGSLRGSGDWPRRPSSRPSSRRGGRPVLRPGPTAVVLAVLRSRGGSAIDLYRRERRQAVVMDADDLPATVAARRRGPERRAGLAGVGGAARRWTRWATASARSSASAHLEGLSLPETAGERLGIPVGTVKSRSHRAYRRLGESAPAVRRGRSTSDGSRPAGRPPVRPGARRGASCVLVRIRRWGRQPPTEPGRVERSAGSRVSRAVRGEPVEGQPAAASSSASSASGRPTTFELLPSTDRTSRPPRPLQRRRRPCRRSPVPTYQAMSASGDRHHRHEGRHDPRGGPAAASARRRRYCTSWVWSDRSRSMRRASAASTGCRGCSRRGATVVSAATTTSSGDAVTASAFSGPGAPRSPRILVAGGVSRRCRAGWRRSAGRSSRAALPAAGRSGGQDQAGAGCRSSTFPLPAVRAIRSRWSLIRPTPNVGLREARAAHRPGRPASRGAGCTGRGPFVWPRWMRWSPGTNRQVGIEAGPEVVELGRGLDHGQPAPDLQPARVSR